MKIAILADIHLKLRSYKEFETERFNSLITHLVSCKYEMVVFSGDLFDFARPTLEEQQLVYGGIKTLSDVSRIYIIAGNHEAVTKTTSTYDYIGFAPYATVVEMDVIRVGGTSITLCDWLNIDSLKHTTGTDVLISHWRSNYGIVTEELNTNSITKKYNITILGDIHHRYSPNGTTHYCGSPYSTKFVQPAEDQFGYLVLDLASLTHEYKNLDLPCKYKFNCTPSEVGGIVEEFNKHLLKISVIGTTEELEKLVKYKNVIYNLVPIHKEELIIKQHNTTSKSNVASTHGTHNTSIIDHIVHSLPSVTNTTLARSVLDEVERGIR